LEGNGDNPLFIALDLVLNNSRCADIKPPAGNEEKF
jgi:hypothetical protein